MIRPPITLTKSLASLAMTLVSTCTCAQSIVANAHFDTDLAGWTTGSGAKWTGLQNHSTGSSGALLFSTTSRESVSQCSRVRFNVMTNLETWVKSDMSSSCSAPYYEVEVSAWSDQNCGSNWLGGYSIRRGDKYEWTVLSPGESSGPFLEEMAQSIYVRLTATCASSDGIASTYFDDVSVEKDNIFLDDFESH